MPTNTRVLALGALALACRSASPRDRSTTTALPAMSAMPAVQRAAASNGEVQEVASFANVPVGIAIARDDRVFLAFSRAIDETQPFSVAELIDGRPVEFPPGFDQTAGAPAPDRLLSVQAVTVDADDRLWILDSAKVGASQIEPGAPKLVAFDLAAGEVVRTITFDAEVAGPTAFLNDVRIDLPRNVAYVTDASAEGPNAVIVVDLNDGTSHRRLDDHPSTRPDPELVLEVDGMPLLQRTGPAAGKPFRIGADGLALSADGLHLYYSPLTSHRLYRVDANVLADRARSDEEVSAAVEDLGDKGFAADGMLADAAGNLYVTDFETSAIHRRAPDGTWEVVARSPQLRWPDTLALRSDGQLLVTVTQIHRSRRFQERDLRDRPFGLYAIPTGSKPLL